MQVATLPSSEEPSVEVVPYDEDWPARYAREAPRVCAALSALLVDCQHFGSTAVPGMWAKPIIDILVGAGRAGAPRVQELEALAEMRYVYLGEDGRRPGRFFFRHREGDLFNLSVVPHNGDLWRDNLALRDYLRRTPGAIDHYSAAKRMAAQAHRGSLRGYQNAKREVVEDLKRAARGTAAS